MKEYLGIDVASRKLNICHLKNDKISNIQIPNRKHNIESIIKYLDLKSKKVVVGVESTGRYHLKCQDIFVNKDFEFRIINPILTSKKISTTIRKKKTDVSDAKHIVDLLMQGDGRIVSKKELDVTKRSVLRTRQTVVKHRTAIKLMLKDLKKEKTDPKIDSTIQSLNGLIDNMDSCVNELEDTVLNETTETEELIDSVTGFATKLSAVVASEVGDFERFPSSSEFKAYVGIDPRVKQSGNSLHTGKITKRGNNYLRFAFYTAAQVARVHDPELKEFYSKKIKEGKPVRVAICAVARKLCERVFAVVRRGTPYQVGQPSSA